ncbi:MAG: alpha/beta fold hydrolase [Coriobacteriales bacterium]|jgi:alpha-beta hydrolase superfamily lysophospholipase
MPVGEDNIPVDKKPVEYTLLNTDDTGASKYSFSYPSKEEGVSINAIAWEPPVADGSKPRGIVQIVHGMVEFIDRYDRYAKFLSHNGFIVVGNDHVGHGDSVISKDDWGYIPMDGGADILLSDIDTLRKIAQERYGEDLPYFIHGHSMGSFIVRSYISKRAEGLAGAIIEGTGNPAPSASKLGLMITSFLAKTRGEKYKSNMVNNMALGSYAKSVPNARTSCDWISRDETVVDTYMHEPRNQFMFTVSGYHALMSLTAEVAQQSCVDRVPKDLPILIESGGEDPVGENGKAPTQLYDMCQKAGIWDVTLKIYEGARHEVHNELNKEEFYNDNLAWLVDHLGGQGAEKNGD